MIATLAGIRILFTLWLKMATVVATAVRSMEWLTPSAKPAMSECTEKSAANK